MTWHPYDHDIEIKPGMALRVKGEDKIYLVGDCNALLGECDCCCLHDITHWRWAVKWPPEEM
jgi:hypothetical protein